MLPFDDIIFVKKEMKHRLIQIISDEGDIVEAQAPVIISASRATDIPAFFADWFFRRLDIGYLKWRNPFNWKYSFVSFRNTRFVVFWTKNPAPLLPYLCKLKERGIGCYIQYTLNDYEDEGLEPSLPIVKQRIETYKRLVEELGEGSVVWRFDPMILTDSIGIDELLHKVANIGDALQGYAEKMVFSYADIALYKKVVRNLDAYNIKYREWDMQLMMEFAERLSGLNALRWGYSLATCSEKIALEEYGIEHNQCIDPLLISRLSPNDAELQNYLFNIKRDSGQRKSCGCIISKDIGQYNTCPHLCKYCYANDSENIVKANYQRHINNPLIDKIV